MSNIRKFSLSCKLFGGYTINVNIYECNNLDDIILIVINSLRNILTQNNFESLINKLNHLNYHIHEITFVNILMDTNINQTYYICSHC